MNPKRTSTSTSTGRPRLRRRRFPYRSDYSTASANKSGTPNVLRILVVAERARPPTRGGDYDYCL
eukprot:scaffold366959_cov19-Prasinocladus_malaysianus.AAC.1